MANTSNPCGLRPITQPYGNMRVNYYIMATALTVYKYMPVDLDTNGRVVASTGSNLSLMVGSIVGFADNASGPIDDSYPYVPANPVMASGSSGFIYAAVADDPNQEFVIEEDTGGTALTQANAHQGCVLIYQTSNSGNTTTGICDVLLDRSGVGTGTDQPIQIIRKLDKPDNDYGNYCKWVVRINRHRYTAGIGITATLV